MKPFFRTNLDACKNDVSSVVDMWPENLVPRVGDRIQMLHYELEVVAVRYEPVKAFVASPGTLCKYQAVVELHAPSWFKRSIQEWEERVKRQRASFFADGKTWPERSKGLESL